MKNRIAPALGLFASLAISLLIIATSGAAAAAAGKACDFWTCPFGCCDEQDNCHTEWSDDYCGYYGEDCEACTYPTPYCFFEGVYAQCTACNVLTCPLGCCDDQGQCHTEQAPEYCGLAGASCNTCTSPEPNCLIGICVGCDAFTCADGCCDPDSVCHTENTPDYCGIAGTDCGACTGDTPNCHNGWCVGCSNDFPCADGCCDLRTSLCYPGDTNEICGAVGASCDNCEIDQLFCQAGQCVACAAGTCGDGCCDANGACHAGTENNFCGTGATTCVNCVSSGQICVDYACTFPGDDDDDDNDNDDDVVPLCGPDNCLAGCCQQDQCWPGDWDDKCGAGAGDCQDCQLNGQVCRDYQCVPPGDDDDDDVTPPADDDDDATPDDDDDDSLDDDFSPGDDDQSSSADDDDDGGESDACGC